MKYLLVWTLVLAFSPSPLFAKRVPPPKVDPVIYDGVKYVAPNNSGTKATIKAVDPKSGKVLWQKTIFEISIDPDLESDVQHIYIKLMKRHKGKLFVTTERDKTYILELKNRKVSVFKDKPPLPEP